MVKLSDAINRAMQIFERIFFIWKILLLDEIRNTVLGLKLNNKNRRARITEATEDVKLIKKPNRENRRARQIESIVRFILKR